MRTLVFLLVLGAPAVGSAQEIEALVASGASAEARGDELEAAILYLQAYLLGEAPQAVESLARLSGSIRSTAEEVLRDDAPTIAASPSELCEIVRARATLTGGSATCRPLRTLRAHGVRAVLLRVVETHATTTDNLAIAISTRDRWLLAGEFYPAYTGQGMAGRLDLRSAEIASAYEIVIEARRTQGWIDGFCRDRPCEQEDRTVERVTCTATGREWRCELRPRPGVWP
jgi:hypothetical protein